MATIDTSIWGPLRTSESWQTVLGDDVHYTQTVNTTLSTGNDKHQPLDNSVCIFGFGSTSPAVNAIAVSYNFAVESYEGVALFPGKTQIPWALAWADDASYEYNTWESGYPAYSYVYGNNYRWVNTCPTQGGYYEEDLLGAGVKPLYYINNDFDYQRKWMVFVLPIVLETHTVDEEEYKEGKIPGSFVTLKDWYDNYKDKYQGICQIVMAPTTFDNNLPTNSGGLSYSLFAEIVPELNIQYMEGDPRKDQQKIDGNFYAYRTYTGAYRHIEGDYFNGFMTIAGGRNFRDDMNVNLALWTPLFMPTVGDWTVHCILPTHVGGTGAGWGFFAGYNPGQKTYAEVEDEIAKIAAHMGTFFIFDMADKNKANDDINVFLGLLDENAISTGEYSRGIANRDSDQFNWDKAGDADYDPGYDPGPEPEPEFDHESVLEAENRTLGVPGANIYVSSLAQFTEIKEAAEDLYAQIIAEAEDGDWDEVARLQSAFGHVENPSDCYYGVVCYPFDITNHLDLTSTSSARLGKSDFTAATNFGQVNSATVYGSIACGQVYMPPANAAQIGQNNINAFINYPPYTTASLYLPFCGTIEIDPAIYMGRYIGVKYVVDWRSGACQALVFRSSTNSSYGELMETISGTMGYRVNFSATDAQAYTSSMVSMAVRADDARRGLLESVKNGIKSTIGSANGKEAIANAVQGGIEIKNAKDTYDIAKYELEAQGVPVKKISTATPATNTLLELTPRLDIYRPNLVYSGPSNAYGEVNGFACLEIGHRPTRLAYGYVVYGKFQLGDGVELATAPKPTSTEASMIKDLLASGVYIRQYPQN